MKYLHFYIQSILILIALGAAIQLPLRSDLIGLVLMIEFFLGVYQLGMGFILLRILSKKSTLLYIYFYSAIAYLLAVITLGVGNFYWMADYWTFALLVFPWGLAIFFLVTIDDLERTRHYRL